jgi:hypothetical protein
MRKPRRKNGSRRYLSVPPDYVIFAISLPAFATVRCAPLPPFDGYLEADAACTDLEWRATVDEE